jgi:hypothetical protein
MTLKSAKLAAALVILSLAFLSTPMAALDCTWSTEYHAPYWFGKWTCSNGCEVLYVYMGGQWSLVDDGCDLEMY